MDAASHRTFEVASRLLRLRKKPRSHAPARSILPLTQLPNGLPTFKGVPHIAHMRPWLQQLGYEDEKIDTLRVIHVAGTKGKGSTCSYIEEFLRHYGIRTGHPMKTGLYTSPHLLKVNERIRINSTPLSDNDFAQAFFDVWERLDIKPEGPGPGYLQILCLMAFHTFLREGVNVAILETHHGGQYDVTNIVTNPFVTVITHIGKDHEKELGPTIENIAWHKAGIFKPGAFAISCQQNSTRITSVLNQRAKDRGISLQYVDEGAQVPDICLPIRAHQQNACLARVAADSFLQQTNKRSLDKVDIKAGIQGFSLRGRFQHEKRNSVSWCLDCAHTPCSATEAAAWFNDLVSSSQRFVWCSASDSMTNNDRSPGNKRILVFGLNSDRHDGVGTLCSLADSLHCEMTYAIFTGNTDPVDMRLLQEFRTKWQARSPGTQVEVIEESREAIKRAEMLAGDSEASILVTGSLHLVSTATIFLDKT